MLCYIWSLVVGGMDGIFFAYEHTSHSFIHPSNMEALAIIGFVAWMLLFLVDLATTVN